MKHKILATALTLALTGTAVADPINIDLGQQITGGRYDVLGFNLTDMLLQENNDLANWEAASMPTGLAAMATAFSSSKSDGCFNVGPNNTLTLYDRLAYVDVLHLFGFNDQQEHSQSYRGLFSDAQYQPWYHAPADGIAASSGSVNPVPGFLLVPEPASMVLLSMGAVLIVGRKTAQARREKASAQNS